MIQLNTPILAYGREEDCMTVVLVEFAAIDPDGSLVYYTRGGEKIEAIASYKREIANNRNVQHLADWMKLNVNTLGNEIYIHGLDWLYDYPIDSYIVDGIIAKYKDQTKL